MVRYVPIVLLLAIILSLGALILGHPKQTTADDNLQVRTKEDVDWRVVDMPLQHLKSGKSNIQLDFRFPEGYRYLSDAPNYLNWASEDESVLRFTKDASDLKLADVSYPFDLPLEAVAGSGRVVLDAVVYYCSLDSRICLFDDVRIRVPLEVSESGASDLSLSVDVRGRTPQPEGDKTVSAV